MSNVAVVWSGGIREYRNLYVDYAATILCLKDQGFNVDLYISTYTHSRLDDFKKIYKPVAVDQQHQNAVTEYVEANYLPQIDLSQCNMWPESRVRDTLCQHYKWKRAYTFFSTYKIRDYDYVIRFRDKINLSYALNKTTLEQIRSSKDIVIPKYGDWRGGINDVFAIGAEDSMRYYHNIIDYAPKYLEQGCYVHPENILCWHLLSGDVRITRDSNIQIFICDDEKNKIEYTRKAPAYE